MTESSIPRPRGWRGWHYRLYDWVLHWSKHPHAQTALFLLSMAEASFFPIPPDALLIAMALALPTRAFRYAAICSAGSIVGGVIGYGIGWGAWELVDDSFYRFVPGFSVEGYERVSALYERWNFWIVFTAGFTPIPYKIFTIAAGATHVNFLIFVLASAISRSARFFLVAGLLRWMGPRITPFIEKYLGWLTLAFVVLLLAGFYLVGLAGSH